MMGTIVTFYSFKGGVGRTSALAQTAVCLGIAGYNVLAIDLDLEAPTLHKILRPKSENNLSKQQGSLALLQRLQEIIGESFRETESAGARLEQARRRTATAVEEALADAIDCGLSEDGVESGGGSVKLLGSGFQRLREDESYERTLHGLDWQVLVPRPSSSDPEAERAAKTLGTWAWAAAFGPLREKLKERFDVILVDSRTGFSDESDLSVGLLADMLVALTGPSHQQAMGLPAAIKRARSASGNGGSSLQVQLVLSPVPEGNHPHIVGLKRYLVAAASPNSERKAYHRPFEATEAVLEIPYDAEMARQPQPQLLERRIRVLQKRRELTSELESRLAKVQPTSGELLKKFQQALEEIAGNWGAFPDEEIDAAETGDPSEERGFWMEVDMPRSQLALVALARSVNQELVQELEGTLRNAKKAGLEGKVRKALGMLCDLLNCAMSKDHKRGPSGDHQTAFNEAVDHIRRVTKEIHTAFPVDEEATDLSLADTGPFRPYLFFRAVRLFANLAITGATQDETLKRRTSRGIETLLDATTTISVLLALHGRLGSYSVELEIFQQWSGFPRERDNPEEQRRRAAIVMGFLWLARWPDPLDATADANDDFREVWLETFKTAAPIAFPLAHAKGA